MPENTHLEIVNEEAERLQEAATADPSLIESDDAKALHAHAVELAQSLSWVPGLRSSNVIFERYRSLRSAIATQFPAFRASLAVDAVVPDDFRWLHDNINLVDMELYGMVDGLKAIRKVPHVMAEGETVMPRPLAIAQGFLSAVQYQFGEQALTSYVLAFQEVTILNMKELIALVPALKMVLLEEIVRRAAKVLQDKNGVHGIGFCITSLREATQAFWKELLEPLILFDRILRQDPAAAYARMDFESRELYRKRVVKVARRSDCNETEVARHALALAREAADKHSDDPRLDLRRSHIGYYLLAEGKSLLHQRVRFRPTFAQRAADFLRTHPDE
ncbi:MAG TPA: hypothetical protein VEI49_05700, partial [Terriglobales bacterium]|nr:hypothetical protein [Terriglobales bacterium]